MGPARNEDRVGEPIRDGPPRGANTFEDQDFGERELSHVSEATPAEIALPITPLVANGTALESRSEHLAFEARPGDFEVVPGGEVVHRNDGGVSEAVREGGAKRAFSGGARAVDRDEPHRVPARREKDDAGELVEAHAAASVHARADGQLGHQRGFEIEQLAGT